MMKSGSSSMIQYSPSADSAYDLSNYWGRLKHFKSLTNQLYLIFCSIILEIGLYQMTSY